MFSQGGGIIDILDYLKRDPAFTRCVNRWEIIPPREGCYAPFPGDLHPKLKGSLEGKGISRLYTHQRECYDRAREGKHVVVVTPTASGKTLCYNLPVLQTLLEEPGTRGMYLFPTKALSQDQQAELNSTVLQGALPLEIFTYDGDTPASIRISAREKGRIIISNPDMLHSGVLPNHPKWIKFFKALKFIVIDEVHIYRGVFGSHFTNLIRRLKRVLKFYGSTPRFICCSATIGNPGELAEKIIGEKAVLVDQNGAPSGEKHFILYNPPVVDQVQGIRRGVVLEAQKLALKFLKKGIKTIVFARSRIRTELIASYIQKSLANIFNENQRIRVASYRGGYLPGERRAIEKGLREGEIQGVVSTNALELGIDIGGLDAAVLAGFPGSISSSWQQAGRAGRQSTLSVSVLVASASPMDQFMVLHPDYFFGRSPESAHIDPENVFVLMDQLKCAIFELPFEEGETFGGDVSELLEYLEEEGVIRFTGGKWYWADRSYPAEGISLRSASQENIIIIDTTKGKNNVIGEMDVPSAKMMLYKHAIYLHRGTQYTVLDLDLENQKAFVQEIDSNYYTDSIVKTDIKVIHLDLVEEYNNIRFAIGDILVRLEVTKFKKLKYHTHENIGSGAIALPAEEMHTRSITLLFPGELKSGQCLENFAEEAQGVVIRRLGNLVKNVAPLFLLCDPGDLGIAERLRDPFFGCSCLYVYETYPGGTGLSEGFLRHQEQILNGIFDLVSQCGCDQGCPSCIGPVEEESSVDFDVKKGVLDFLGQLSGEK